MKTLKYTCSQEFSDSILDDIQYWNFNNYINQYGEAKTVELLIEKYYCDSYRTSWEFSAIYNNDHFTDILTKSHNLPPNAWASDKMGVIYCCSLISQGQKYRECKDSFIAIVDTSAGNVVFDYQRDSTQQIIKDTTDQVEILYKGFEEWIRLYKSKGLKYILSKKVDPLPKPYIFKSFIKPTAALDLYMKSKR